MTSSIYLFADDLADEGVSSVLDRVRAAGVASATLAATYHHSRDVFPHGVHRKVQQLEGGVAYFRPRLEHYGRIKPVASRLTEADDPLAELAKQMPTSAWLVVLHNSRLAEQFPDCAPLTAFGDRLLNSLCPAHPDARAYAVALASDIARKKLQAIKLEAVHFMGFDHGGHHERSFVPLSPNIRFLLGVCFCEYCRRAAHEVDADELRRRVAERIEAVLGSSSAETREAEVDDDAMREILGAYVAARQRTVTSLVAKMAHAVHAQAPSTRVIFLDPSGASLGYATGRPGTQRSALSIGWRDGIDVPSLSQVTDGVAMLGYFAEHDRFERELGAYLQAVPPERLEVIMRPMPPDTASTGELRQRVAGLRQRGIGELSFYHYGFMRLENLAWIAEALR